MDLKEKIKQLPHKSGVYLFIDKKGKALYIGKAGSLKNRVSSYFSKSHVYSLKMTNMIDRIHDVEYIITASEMEALLLESRLVKINKPYYNTQLKDDKSYPYIQISIKHPFPAIQLIRENSQTNEQEVRYYGPFVDVELTRKAVKKLRQIFKIRNCNERKYEKGKACLDFQIGLCSAPCVPKIEKNDYRKNVKECCLLLSGQHQILLRNLRREMNIASQLMFYEKAAAIRDTIKMIEKVISQEKISRCYRKKLDMYLNERINDSSIRRALLDLQNYLGISTIPLHIEAFDISNIHGQEAVGSMIVFKSGIPDRKCYRHFRIKEVKGINDFEMMREILYRRFRDNHLKSEKLPDLVLLDGGKGQLSIVHKVLQELNVEANLVALAKREEELYRPGKKEPILLPEHSEAFFLVQRVRDEAHRFAIQYHKKLRSKRIKKSIIDFIPGIGEKRKQQLLSKFKSIEHIRKAEIDELVKIWGVGEKTAHKIKDILEVWYDSGVQG